MMTMQDALKSAHELGVFARPISRRQYSYSYESSGSHRLVTVHGPDRWGATRSGYWRTMTQEDIEDEWILCDVHGDIIRRRRAAEPKETLTDLLRDKP